MTAGAFSVVVCVLPAGSLGGLHRHCHRRKLSLVPWHVRELQRIVEPRYRKDRVYRCGSTIVCLFQAGRRQNISGREMFPAPFVFFWLGQPRPFSIQSGGTRCVRSPFCMGQSESPITLCNLRACASSDVVELGVSCRGSMLPVK